MSAKVTHPNVAKTFDYLVDGGREYLIEEFVKGRDLDDVMSNKYFTLDPHLAAHVFHHLAKGLEAVHREGIIHRDIKPKNVMVSSDPGLTEVKITDFGIAKLAELEIGEAVKDGSPTMASQTVLGAIPYMAPEVLKNRNDVSISADVWSIGAMLYTLLVGEPPFGVGLQAVPNILSAKEPPATPASFTAAGQFSTLLADLWGAIQACLTIDAVKRPTAIQLVSMCNAFCYSRGRRSEGVVNSYRPKHGAWGTISTGDGESDVFFHASSFWGAGSPHIDARVSFAAFPGDPKPRANPVLLLR